MKVGLFVPCYVDALYPEVGVSTYRLLKSLGLDVDYPELFNSRYVDTPTSG